MMKSYSIDICGSKSIAREGNNVEFMEATPALKCIASVQFDDFCFSPMLPVMCTNLTLVRLFPLHSLWFCTSINVHVNAKLFGVDGHNFVTC